MSDQDPAWTMSGLAAMPCSKLDSSYQTACAPVGASRHWLLLLQDSTMLRLIQSCKACLMVYRADEADEAQCSCCFCGVAGPETEMDCIHCQNIIPFCIASGTHADSSVWTVRALQIWAWVYACRCNMHELSWVSLRLHSLVSSCQYSNSYQCTCQHA